MNANASKTVDKDEPISRRVIGCAFEVSNILGPGFLESVYENALCVELAEQRIPFERQRELVVRYKDRVVGTFVADILVAGELLVELKAVNRVIAEHSAQVMNYLRGTGLSVGLLLNFGTPRLGVNRIVWRHDDHRSI
ncbi:GxxExxY protein [Candidatus Thiosymbion oneisti]|uniref:GxxExxY protein n=1 Tax=Candidatus Thiosymbion oneisti TaxID=589554 RepID=UPI000B088FD7|nr:GxxExxY protein [Candidatus Thiosymbion oneisti]